MPESQNSTQSAVIDSPSRWSRPAGYRDVLVVAVPLVLSTSSWTVQHFVDRMFLAWYDPTAMAAAMPSGLLAFTLIGLLMFTAGYANVFVAQYHGAGQTHRIGTAVWQSVWFALITAPLMPLIALGAESIFRWSGHSPELQALEATFFRIHLFGGCLTVYINALNSFYSGRGKSWPLVWINLLITVVNVVLCYGMIFGNLGFPRMGIAGSALATVCANFIGAAVLTWIVLAPANNAAYATRNWRFDPMLFRRLLRFGIPSGMQLMLDILAFTIFTVIVGRIGATELAATNVAIQINMLAFMPMIGCGIAVQTVVGNWLGAGRPDLSARATWSAFHMASAYVASFAMLYLLVPQLFLRPFAAHADPSGFAGIQPLAIAVLRFVAIYCIFDTMTIMFSAALKGAGDTRFVMVYALIVGWVTMVVPAWIAVEKFHAGIMTAWTFLTLYVTTTGIGFFLRFLQGNWRSMRVIETHLPIVPASLPDVPGAEADA